MNDEQKNKPISLVENIKRYINGRPIQLNDQEIKSDIAGYSLISKLVQDTQNETFDSQSNLSNTTPSLDYLLGMASEKAQEIDDNETLMQLFPDLSRGAQILISYILSPTFISSKPELVYTGPDRIFTPMISKQMLDAVRDYMEKGYGINGRLYEILYKILFTKGSYALAVIPESSLDELINPEVSTESNSFKLTKLSKEELDRQLSNPIRRNNGFAAKAKPMNHFKPFEHKGINVSRENYNLNQLSVGHGDTQNGFTPQYTFTSKPSQSIQSQNQYDTIDTRIMVSTEMSWELPKELFTGLTTDQMRNIHVSQEGSWQIKLGNNKKQVIDTFVEYTDDLTIIHQGYMRQQMVEQNISNKLGLARENFYYSNAPDSDKNLIEKLFKRVDSYTQNGYTNNANLKVIKSNTQTYRKDLSEPLIMEYPAESIIPIYKPGSPSEHIGYLALHDEEGAPLSKVKPINYYRDLKNNFNMRSSGSEMAHSLIQQGRNMFGGTSSVLDEGRQLEILSRIHGNSIVKEILNRTREGELGKNIDIGDSTEAFRIMFYRALRGQTTRVLFLPKDIMTYMAVDYNNKGIGRSLIDNMHVLMSLRLQFTAAQVRTGIANSTHETIATIRIDERDPDPRKTIATANNLILKTRQNSGLLIGTSDLQTIEDRLNASNVRLAIESDNPKIPRIGYDMSRSTAEIPTPDNEVGELLTRLTQMGLLLPPELIDNSYGVDFAREILQQNFLVSMAASNFQAKLNPYFTSFVKKVILASPILRKELHRIVRSNIVSILEQIHEVNEDKVDMNALDKKSLKIIIDYLVDKFIAGINVNLPEIVNDNDDMFNDQINKMETRVDKVLDYLWSSEVLPVGIVGDDMGTLIDQYKGVVKGVVMRKFLFDMDYSPEVFDFISISDKGEQTYEKNKEIREMSIQVIKNVVEFFKESANIKKTTDAVVKANEIETDGGGSDFSSNSDDDGGFGDFGDDGFGDDDGEEGGEDGNNDGGDEPGWDTPAGDDGNAD